MATTPKNAERGVILVETAHARPMMGINVQPYVSHLFPRVRELTTGQPVAAPHATTPSLGEVP